VNGSITIDAITSALEILSNNARPEEATRWRDGSYTG